MQTWYFVLENKTKIDIIWCHKTIQIWTCIYLSVCFSTQAALNIILHCTISLYFFHFLLLPSLVSAVLFFPKAATLHLNLMVAQIKIRGVRVSDSMAALRHVQREREEGGGGQEGWTVAQKLIVLAGFPIRAAHMHPNPRLNTPTSLSSQQRSYKSLPPLFLLV